MSSTYLSHRWWARSRSDGLDLKLFHEQVSNEGANRGTNGFTMDLFKMLIKEEEGCVLKAKLQQGGDLGD